MYITRTIETTLTKMVKSFKVVLLTGSRQVGKSTTLSYLFDDDYEYVTLDNLIERELAQRDPKAFFLNHPGSIIIDECQYAPGLFQEIKYRVDQSDSYGQYILTGSQTFSLMAGITESLAGRVGILHMSGLSLREIREETTSLPFVPTTEFLDAARPGPVGLDLWEKIHRGSLPELYKNPDLDHQLYYASYLSTYLERDVRLITNVRDLGLFSRFINILAARVSSLLNYNEIARDIGVDSKTVKSWIAILEASGVIVLLQPFSNNHLTRVVKTPVLYFMDTGLLAHLLRWTTAETMMNGAMSGQILENFAVSEVIKSFYNAGITKPPIYFYRDRDQREIDLIIESSGVLYPVEIKQSMAPNPGMAKHLGLLSKAKGYEIGLPLILSQVEKKRYIAQDLLAFPVGAI